MSQVEGFKYLRVLFKGIEDWEIDMWLMAVSLGGWVWYRPGEGEALGLLIQITFPGSSMLTSFGQWIKQIQRHKRHKLLFYPACSSPSSGASWDGLAIWWGSLLDASLVGTSHYETLRKTQDNLDGFCFSTALGGRWDSPLSPSGWGDGSLQLSA